MAEQPLVSIVVPVYNGRKYLEQCIASIRAQQCPDWELLLIDDGSTDGSRELCDSYAADTRIHSFHQPNSGAAAARNHGIAQARGSWICFADCDDWMEPAMLDSMLAAARQNDAQVAVCGYVAEYAHHSKQVACCQQPTVLQASEASQMLLEGKIGSYMWTFLFKREMVCEPVFNLKVYEDHATLFKWVAHAQRVVLMPQTFYHYRQLDNSLLHASGRKASRDFFLAAKERYQYIERRRLFPGWEAKNRSLYLASCIKYTKDLARMDNYGPEQRQMIEEARDELRRFMPVGSSELSRKNYIRLRMLMKNVDLYVRLLRLSSVFSLGNRRKKTF